MPGTKLFIKHLLGRDLWIRRRRNPPTEFFGSRYGGWALDTRLLGAESVVYSFGIGEDASFDLALIQSRGCLIHGFDPTPKSLEWVRGNVSDERFRMRPWALGSEDGELELWLPENPEHVSATCARPIGSSRSSFNAECLTLGSVMKRLGHERIDVLKMDIEGAEYGVIENICRDRTIERVGQLLVEFHHWIQPFVRDDTRTAMNGLAAAGFHVGWVSESGHEVLFVR